jgi:hypothetical protein
LTQEYSKDSDPRTSENAFFPFPSVFPSLLQLLKRYTYVCSEDRVAGIYIISFGVEQVPEGEAGT